MSNQEYPIDIGQRLELFIDDHLISRMHGLELRLHSPTPQEVALKTDRPWEGNACGMISVFQDEGKYRMYYRGWQIMESTEHRTGPECTCYAESDDGIHWERPELNLVEFDGSTANNILLGRDERFGLHTLTPFKDTNPAPAGDARYKSWAIGGNPNHEGPRSTPGSKGLFAMKSADGIHWSPAKDEPVLTCGRFDSHNVCFWDEVIGKYRSYHRNWLESEDYTAHEDAAPGIVRGSRTQRDLLTATSDDFLNWSESEFLTYEMGKPDHLYTNSVIPYFRAPHILVGFPMRYIDRGWSDAMEDLPDLEHRRMRAEASERYGSALTDAMFMSSRNGNHFHLWHESFIRPGLRPQDSWTYADLWPNWGIVTTKSRFTGAPDELSFYLVEGYWRGDSLNFRRYTMRQDGFVSLNASAAGGELVTRPFTFSGSELSLNFSASAAGSLRVEILQDEEDVPIPGFTFEDCREILGDDLNRTVKWNGSADVGRLAGLPIRLRFRMKDADLFAMQFKYRSRS